MSVSQHSLLASLLCVCLHCTVSSAYTSVHNLATHMCHLPYNCHLHSQWARLCHTKVACHISCIVVALALTETRRFGILLIYFTLVAELRSSVMSGATDRREDEQVPQFYGRIDEKKIAEWETDVRLWQVEFKVEDRDRLGPRLRPCENEARNTSCCTIHSGQQHSMPQRQRLWRTS